MKAELGKLIELAERLLAQYEATERRLLLARIGQATIVASGLGLSILSFFGFGATDVQTRTLLALAAGLLTITYAVMIELVLVTRARRRLHRDGRALQQVLAVVQDAVITAAIDWSPLERAEFAVRLSRFEVAQSIGRQA